MFALFVSTKLVKLYMLMWTYQVYICIFFFAIHLVAFYLSLLRIIILLRVLSLILETREREYVKRVYQPSVFINTTFLYFACVKNGTRLFM